MKYPYTTLEGFWISLVNKFLFSKIISPTTFISCKEQNFYSWVYQAAPNILFPIVIICSYWIQKFFHIHSEEIIEIFPNFISFGRLLSDLKSAACFCIFFIMMKLILSSFRTFFDIGVSWNNVVDILLPRTLSVNVFNPYLLISIPRRQLPWNFFDICVTIE